ncbi:MAG: hypothetical protein H6Q94_1327 [Nitrospirae bacterium]|nr:hypothetical protein [Nitrospirota bacterium]
MDTFLCQMHLSVQILFQSGKIYTKEYDMTHQPGQSDGIDKRPDEKEISDEREAGEGGEITCRCKEVSKKTFPEMLRLMISDLVFWKKAKGPK